MSNQNTYESESVVSYFSGVDHLQKPEQTILNILKDKLKSMNMLDVGVGGGRTTIHFSKLVNRYIGIDYSEKMIEACEKRFSKNENIIFQVADARTLDEFNDGSFDFVLFSFNGLDYINNNDRIKALKEIKRVLKNEGVFVFSSHNLYNLNKLFSIEFSINPIKLVWRILRLCLLFLLNGSPKKLKKMNWAIINDGAHKFGLKTFYIKPSFQLKQLEELKFKDIQLFSLDNGKEISTSQLNEIDDPWIYYLCKT